MLKERGAIVDYVLLVTLVVLTSYYALYSFFQNQTKPICMAIAPLNSVSQSEIKWGATPGSSSKVACYTQRLSTGKGAGAVVDKLFFEAGFVVIGN